MDPVSTRAAAGCLAPYPADTPRLRLRDVSQSGAFPCSILWRGPRPIISGPQASASGLRTRQLPTSPQPTALLSPPPAESDWTLAAGWGSALSTTRNRPGSWRNHNWLWGPPVMGRWTPRPTGAGPGLAPPPPRGRPRLPPELVGSARRCASVAAQVLELSALWATAEPGRPPGFRGAPRSAC